MSLEAAAVTADVDFTRELLLAALNNQLVQDMRLIKQVTVALRVRATRAGIWDLLLVEQHGDIVAPS